MNENILEIARLNALFYQLIGNMGLAYSILATGTLSRLATWATIVGWAPVQARSSNLKYSNTSIELRTCRGLVDLGQAVVNVEVRDVQGNVTRVKRHFHTAAGLIFTDGFQSGDTSGWSSSVE